MAGRRGGGGPVRRLQLQASVCNWTGWADAANTTTALIEAQASAGGGSGGGGGGGGGVTVNPFVLLALDLGDLAARLRWCGAVMSLRVGVGQVWWIAAVWADV
jgi:hypothetical protein